MQKIVLASGNQGKIKEMSNILAGYGFEVHSQNEFNIEPPEETGLTFIENSILKARYASKITGLPALADDSGLVVPALNGEPGLFSARYAGINTNDAKNRQKLLANLENVPREQRQATFVCLIALVRYATDPNPIIAHGECSGILLDEERGNNGFGYDPIFLYEDLGLTFAEIELAEKQKISHRAKALVELKHKLGNL